MIIPANLRARVINAATAFLNAMRA